MTFSLQGKKWYTILRSAWGRGVDVSVFNLLLCRDCCYDNKKLKISYPVKPVFSAKPAPVNLWNILSLFHILLWTCMTTKIFWNLFSKRSTAHYFWLMVKIKSFIPCAHQLQIQDLREFVDWHQQQSLQHCNAAHKTGTQVCCHSSWTSWQKGCFLKPQLRLYPCTP